MVGRKEHTHEKMITRGADSEMTNPVSSSVCQNMTKCVTSHIHASGVCVGLRLKTGEDAGCYTDSGARSHHISVPLLPLLYSNQIPHRETLMNTITQSPAKILSLRLPPTFNFFSSGFVHIWKFKDVLLSFDP